MLGVGDRKRKMGGGILQHQQQQQQQRRHQQQPPHAIGGGNGHMIHQQQHRHQQQQQSHYQLPQSQQQMMMPAIGNAAVQAAIGALPGSQTSCVLFVDDVPQNTSELELKRVFQEFGKLEQIFIVPGKHRALVEFLRATDAERAVSMHQSGYPIAVNGGNVSVSFSNRSRIDTGQESYQSATPQTSLLLTFYNVRMEFNCESIRQICSPYGLLDRCLLIRQQDGLFRAVLEFEKLEDAVLTKPNLNGANMYAGCNSIRCEYVRHTAFEYFSAREAVLEEYRYEAYGAAAASADAVGAIAGLLAKRPRLPQQLEPSNAAAAAAAAADLAASLGAAGLLMQQQLQHHQHHRAPQQQQLQAPVAQHHQHSSAEPSAHNVIVVRDLSPQMNCDRLFNILVLYGNVVRIKFITSRKGFALVQMMDAASAQQAVDFFHGQTILGCAVKVTHSDQGALKRVTKEFSLADGSPADKSFEGAKLNRFMTQEAVAKNLPALGRTGRILYYWGCPDGTTEAAIRAALKLAGASDPESVSLQSEKGSTGWITFANVADATDAICLANHAPVGGDSARLKLSYAVKK